MIDLKNLDLFKKDLSLNPKFSIDIKKGFLASERLSNYNLVFLAAHFKMEHDPWLLRSERSRFETEEINGKAKENKNSKCLDEDSGQRLLWYNPKFTRFEAEIEPKFKNLYSLKFKISSNKLLEVNFLIKDLISSNQSIGAEKLSGKGNINLHSIYIFYLKLHK